MTPVGVFYETAAIQARATTQVPTKRLAPRYRTRRRDPGSFQASVVGSILSQRWNPPPEFAVLTLCAFDLAADHWSGCEQVVERINGNKNGSDQHPPHRNYLLTERTVPGWARPRCVNDALSVTSHCLRSATLARTFQGREPGATLRLRCRRTPRWFDHRRSAARHRMGHPSRRHRRRARSSGAQRCCEARGCSRRPARGDARRTTVRVHRRVRLHIDTGREARLGFEPQGSLQPRIG